MQRVTAIQGLELGVFPSPCHLSRCSCVLTRLSRNPQLHGNCESLVRRKSLIDAVGDQLSTKHTRDSQGVSGVLWEQWENRIPIEHTKTRFPVALNCTATI